MRRSTANVHLRPGLLEAALSVNVSADAHVAASLADAFGPYGVPLSMLDASAASGLLGQFVHVEDFDRSKQIAALASRSSRRLAFTQPDFARELLGKLSGPNQQEMIEAFVGDAPEPPFTRGESLRPGWD